jgi:hypothetical protein
MKIFKVQVGKTTLFFFSVMIIQSDAKQSYK